MQQGVDSRAMFAVFVIKLPKLLILAVAGAVFGSGLNVLVTLMKAQNNDYVSETEYYIDFAEGRYEARDYYNDFTWNDVLATDLILGRAMELLGADYDRNRVKKMITANILSDVRYLTITIKGQDSMQVEAVKTALGMALEEFGESMAEFDAIFKIEDLEIVQEKTQYFAWRAALLGLAAAVGIGIFVIAFRFCMGSAFYTKNDIIKNLDLPVFGMIFANGHQNKKMSMLEQRQWKMLEENLKACAEENPRMMLIDASEGHDAAAFLEYIRARKVDGLPHFEICDMVNDDQWMKKIQGTVVMAVIPFGRTCREKITDEMHHVQMHGGRIIAAVLAQTDRKWAEIYYALRI